MKNGCERDKIEANTPQAFNPPNYSRVQKPRKPRKAPKQYKPTRNKRNPLKTPLKCEIRHISRLMQESKSNKADKRQGTRHKRTTANRWQVLSLERSCNPATSGHHHRPKERAHRKPLQSPKLKYILDFALFCLRKSRENTKPSK